MTRSQTIGCRYWHSCWSIGNNFFFYTYCSSQSWGVVALVRNKECTIRNGPLLPFSPRPCSFATLGFANTSCMSSEIIEPAPCLFTYKEIICYSQLHVYWKFNELSFWNTKSITTNENYNWFIIAGTADREASNGWFAGRVSQLEELLEIFPNFRLIPSILHYKMCISPTI